MIQSIEQTIQTSFNVRSTHLPKVTPSACSGRVDELSLGAVAMDGNVFHLFHFWSYFEQSTTQHSAAPACFALIRRQSRQFALPPRHKDDLLPNKVCQLSNMAPDALRGTRDHTDSTINLSSSHSQPQLPPYQSCTDLLHPLLTFDRNLHITACAPR